MSTPHGRWSLGAVIGLALSLSAPGVLSAQVCSCGGAPLLSSLEFGGVAEGNLRFSLAYEYHDISDVVWGTEQRKNDSRWQVSQSGLFMASYGLTPTMSISAIVTLVQKERAAGDRLLVRGLGDGLLLANVSLLRPNPYTQQELVVSAGIKGPIGSSTLSLDGTLIAADLQPTSGAWDGIVAAYFATGVGVGSPLRLFTSAAYRWTGTNQRYAFGDLGYKTGNELVATLGAGYAWGARLSATLMGEYRIITSDQIGGFETATTGGQWLDLTPGVNIRLSRALSLGLSGQLPLYRRLAGPLQLTTNYSVTAALFYELGAG